MVCIFCVFLSEEFREALKRRWMKWRYGILIETVGCNISPLIRITDVWFPLEILVKPILGTSLPPADCGVRGWRILRDHMVFIREWNGVSHSQQSIKGILLNWLVIKILKSLKAVDQVNFIATQPNPLGYLNFFQNDPKFKKTLPTEQMEQRRVCFRPLSK